jgi:hypothetical protein
MYKYKHMNPIHFVHHRIVNCKSHYSSGSVDKQHNPVSVNTWVVTNVTLQHKTSRMGQI